MERYQDKAPLQSNIAQPNLLASSQRRNLTATTQGAQGVLGSLNNFFNKVGNIADEFGKQNAQIQGENEAQANTVEWLKATDTKKELEATLSNSNLTEQQRQLAENELSVTNSNINDYISATKKNPSINVKDIAMQQTQAKLFRTNLSNQYTDMTEQAYETFKYDPKGFAEATQKLTKDFMKTVPEDIIGDALTGFKNVNSQVASKVHQNYITQQNDIMIAETKKNIDTSIDNGTKFAYAGGDYRVQVKNIVDSYSNLYQNHLITKEQYAFQTDKIEKEFKTQHFMGLFDRTIGFDAEHKFLPNANQIKAGYKEIENFSNTVLKQKKGESLAEYQLRTANLNQDEVNGIVKTMRSKLVKGEAAIKKANTASIKAYTTQTKTAYKMMMKGVKPSNYDEIKKLAYANGDKQGFDNASFAMNKIQTINDLPLSDQVDYADNLMKQKKTGMTELDYTIDTTVQKNIRHKASLAKSDISQLATEDGMFTDISQITDPQEQLKEFSKRKVLVENGQFFAKYSKDPESLISDNEANVFNSFLDNHPSKVLPMVASLEQSLGVKYTKPILQKMFKKQATAVVYAADRFKTDPTSANMIIAGIEYMKNGGKLETDDSSTWNDNAPAFESTLATLGNSGDAIRKSAKAYYMMMPDKDVTKAYAAVTNGIDGGIIVHKPGQSYDDTYGEISKLTEYYSSGHRVAFKQKLNGEPTIGYDKLAEMINDDDVHLRSVGQGKYTFITTDTGSVITTDNKPVVINLNEEE